MMRGGGTAKEINQEKKLERGRERGGRGEERRGDKRESKIDLLPTRSATWPWLDPVTLWPWSPTHPPQQHHFHNNRINQMTTFLQQPPNQNNNISTTTTWLHWWQDGYGNNFLPRLHFLASLQHFCAMHCGTKNNMAGTTIMQYIGSGLVWSKLHIAWMLL